MSEAQTRPFFNEKEVYLVHKMLSAAREELVKEVCFSNGIAKRECCGCGLYRYCNMLQQISGVVNAYAVTTANTTFNDRRKIGIALRKSIGK